MDREKYALQIDAAAVLAEVNAILATCGLDPSPDDTTIARLALLRGWVLETLAKDTANRKRLAAVETERDEARAYLAVHQWQATDDPETSACPECGGLEWIGHEPKCALAKAAGLGEENNE